MLEFTQLPILNTIGVVWKISRSLLFRSPKIQPATITTIDRNHISTSHLAKTWEIEDEWYNFKDLNPSINELLNLEEDSYDGGKNGEYHPITWYHEFGGRSFYTGLGHRETYHDERFIKLLLGGILYAAGN